MKHIKFDKMPSNFELVLAGDFHVGNADVSDTKVKRLVRLVQSKKNMYIAFGGDQLEAISVTDRRFNADEHGGRESRINAQRDAFLEYFMPVADKTLWILDGNHEYILHNIYQVTDDIAKAMGTTYANGVMLKALFPGFRLLDWHGAGYINSRAGSALQRKTNDKVSLVRKLRDLPCADCELAVSHHFHKIMITRPAEVLQLISNTDGSELRQHYTKPTRIWIDEDKRLYRIAEDDRWYVASGALLRSYVEGRSSYAERFGYRPTEMGVAIVEVRNDKIKGIRPEHLE